MVNLSLFVGPAESAWIMRRECDNIKALFSRGRHWISEGVPCGFVSIIAALH
jgi:hypothetical protein